MYPLESFQVPYILEILIDVRIKEDFWLRRRHAVAHLVAARNVDGWIPGGGGGHWDFSLTSFRPH